MRTDRKPGHGSSMNAVALLRRSTNMQDKSIEEQRQFIAGWARANGYTILAEHVDDAISGDDHEIVWAVETFQKHEVLKQTSRDTLRGLLALARKGFWCGGPVPYGYDAEIIDKLTQKPVRRVRLIRRLRTLPDGSKLPAIHHIL